MYIYPNGTSDYITKDEFDGFFDEIFSFFNLVSDFFSKWNFSKNGF